MSLFPPASGPLPPLPELAHDMFVRPPRRRVEAAPSRTHSKRQVMDGLLAFLAARARATACGDAAEDANTAKTHAGRRGTTAEPTEHAKPTLQFG